VAISMQSKVISRSCASTCLEEAISGNQHAIRGHQQELREYLPRGGN